MLSFSNRQLLQLPLPYCSDLESNEEKKNVVELKKFSYEGKKSNSCSIIRNNIHPLQNILLWKINYYVLYYVRPTHWSMLGSVFTCRRKHTVYYYNRTLVSALKTLQKKTCQFTKTEETHESKPQNIGEDKEREAQLFFS